MWSWTRHPEQPCAVQLRVTAAQAVSFQAGREFRLASLRVGAGRGWIGVEVDSLTSGCLTPFRGGLTQAGFTAATALAATLRGRQWSRPMFSGILVGRPSGGGGMRVVCYHEGPQAVDVRRSLW